MFNSPFFQKFPQAPSTFTDDDGNDVFVHITAVQNSGLNGLNEGQKVSYELEEQRNGKMAAVDLSVVE